VEDFDIPGTKGRTIIGVKNPDALRFELKHRLVRRTKGEVLDLPEKVREYVPVKLNTKQRKAYEEAEAAFWLSIEQAVKEGDKDAAHFAEQVLTGKKRIYELANGAARTVRLRQVASTPALLGGLDDSAKLDAAVEIITDAQPKQFVVFTEFVETANILCERLRKHDLTAAAFTGEVTDTSVRTDYENKFQSGDIDVLVGTLGAMRESITLTAADTVIFVERAWVPAWNEQAEDRLWRNGQKNQVTVLILEAEDTVDQDKVKPANVVKEAIVASVLKKDTIKEAA
jgi:SNF2 family DNA or RNA helicase